MQDTNWTIDTLNLHLPGGFAHRADAIARQVGRELARLALDRRVELARLDLPRIMLQGGETNFVIARRIAHAIRREIVAEDSGEVQRDAGGQVKQRERVADRIIPSTPGRKSE